MKNTLQNIKLIALAVVLSFGLNLAYAWVVPTAAPPGGNAAQPITTKGGQTINGSLSIGTATAPADLIVSSLAIAGPIVGGVPTKISSTPGQLLAFSSPKPGSPSNVEWVDPGKFTGTPTVSIAATPPSIKAGDAVALKWNTTDFADTCTKTGGGGSATWTGTSAVTDILDAGGKATGNGFGQTVEHPTVDTTYTVTCTNSVSKKTSNPASVTVTVTTAPVVTLSIVATPDASGNAKLAWSATGIITSCNATGSYWSGTRPTTSGATPETVGGITTAPRDYSFACTGPGGTTSKTVTMPAAPVPTASITSLYVSSRTGCGSTYCNNNYATVVWTSTNATSCEVPAGSETPAWGGPKAVSGTETGNYGTMRKKSGAGEYHVYWLTCTGAGGSDTTSKDIQF